MNRFKQNVIIFLAIFIAIIGSSYELYLNSSRVIGATNSADYSQPRPQTNAGTWRIQSIDTQIISKDWPNVPRASIQEQIALIKNLGVNYVAIDTPYDRLDELKMWVTEVHQEGLHVWFRSHWDEWEGDDGKPATMTPQEYLDNTEYFIKSNPNLFLPGDSFT